MEKVLSGSAITGRKKTDDQYDFYETPKWATEKAVEAMLIDGILNNSKLTGIGTLEFVSAGRIILSEDLAGYCLVYRAVHSDDDTIEPEDE